MMVAQTPINIADAGNNCTGCFESHGAVLVVYKKEVGKPEF